MRERLTAESMVLRDLIAEEDTGAEAIVSRRDRATFKMGTIKQSPAKSLARNFYNTVSAEPKMEQIFEEF